MHYRKRFHVYSVYTLRQYLPRPMTYGTLRTTEMEGMSDAALLRLVHVEQHLDRHVAHYLQTHRPDLLVRYVQTTDLPIPADIRRWVETQRVSAGQPPSG